MLEDKNIDRLFQEKLKDMEVTPNPEVWNAIEQKLQKKKRRVIPFWWMSIGSAACILLGVVFLWKNTKNNIINDNSSFPVIRDEVELSTKEEKEEEKVIVVDLDEKKEKLKHKEKNRVEEERNKTIKSYTAEGKSIEKKNIGVYESGSKTKAINNSISIYNNAKSQSSSIDETILAQKEINVNSNDFLVKNDDELLVKEDIKLEDDKVKVSTNKKEEQKKNFIAEVSEEIDIEKETTSSKKWKINPVLGILQSNSFSDDSPIDESLNSNSFSGENNIAFGVNVEYRINKRWSFKSGVQLQKSSFSSENLVALTQNDVLSYSAVNEMNVSDDSEVLSHEVSDDVPVIDSISDDLSSDGGNPDVIDIPNSESPVVVNPSAEAPKENVDSSDKVTSLRQVYSYIEFPLEAKYTFFRKPRTQISLLTGFSTLFLNENQITSVSGNSEEIIGELTSLNTVNFSGNLGVDFDFLLFDKIHFNINPMFKSQINTLKTNSTDFQPYLIGVYSGIKYQF